jgi:antitoxin component of MazEF toxin-antitoxin module
VPLKRKIFQLGRSYVVTLPKSWVETARAEHGDFEHVLVEVNNELRLKPDAKKADLTKMSAECDMDAARMETSTTMQT